ncbi:MAG: SUMF1/EgtB/PvdO family nonheme iron enzyme [Pyrinomonadaceae bacterium]|nr:SUMF1/EgtB/PvdO family nonheme iron enzyme [Pyrinomonadaceae bacterium]
MKECQHCKACYSDEVANCPADGMPTVHTISGEPVLDGKYKLESRIGQGGMGVVYRARHSYLKTLHAIKIILPDLVGNDPQLVTRFRQEALAAAAIRHQNVVQVTDYGVAQDTMPFLVMEFVEGESLHDLLAREKRLSPEKAFELVKAMCAGIGAAHRQGIVHRDMKPLNIMLLKGKSSAAEAVKILDFGLAKIKSGELLGSFIQAQTTGLMGSPYYMAPEQWSDEDLGPQSDIYSIGVMLYQMLAGDVPFKGSSIPAIMQKHLNEPPPPFSEKGVSIPPAIEKTVLRTLAKKTSERTQTVEQFVAEYEAALKGEAIPAATQTALPSAPLKVLTNPPKSSVYLNDVSVGESRDDGWLLLEGVQSGQHLLRVNHSGYREWSESVVCDGNPREVVARLEPAEATSPEIPKPDETLGGSTGDAAAGQTNVTPVENTAGIQSIHQQSAVSQPIPQKRGFFSPLTLALIGIFGLLVLTGIGTVGAYVFGAFDGLLGRNEPSPTATPVQSPTGQTTGQDRFQNELIRIEGGTLKMGRNDGTPFEKPEHEVKVESFSMDKTEVTNAEYYAFITETDYPQIPVDWVAMSKKPVAGKELMPVRYVSIEDAEAFAKWRSERDGKQYRLPTEAEWEFAARNGSEGTLYPWGDEHRAECAVVGKLAATPEKVGSKECGATKSGIQDLVGNVFEWTSSEAKPYPGGPVAIQNRSDKRLMIIRGGSAFRDQNGKNSETSTFRLGVQEDLRDNRLGFRLVTSDGNR